ncbi:LPS assembly lipoprotein LptE [Notoacmeibacter ruber]|uniref:LPS-assembly lipoprotein n=1 Tax=Notoacmeibacter ruber TaxID=2670375 RepID=A0A3L7JE60_9HYPH|nr:LPS assembly lipoprotein LptE [Notoacmeibacter ruber]RLQ88966.1 hypothetical protein D8780_12715 [Notoacmeibacter ruber]
MWLSDRASSVLSRLAGICALLTLAACSVQPLYGTSGSATMNRLPIEVADVSGPDRPAFMLRDELVFLINGGRSQPVGAPFRLDIVLERKNRVSNTAPVADGEINRTFAGQVELRANYELVNVETDEVITSGRRRAFAQYDRSTQLYALRAAQEDAEEDAARELARIVVLAINGKLKTYVAPQIVVK